MLCGVVLLAIFVRSIVLDTHAQLDIVGEQAFVRDGAEYQKSIDNKLNSSIWNRLKPTINNQKLSEQIEAEFPELQEIVVTTPFLQHKPRVKFMMAEPEALVSSNNATYIIGSNGRVLCDLNDKAPTLSVSDLPVIVDTSSTSLSLGKPALTTEQIAYVKQLYRQSEAKNIKISQIELQPAGTEIRVRFDQDKYFVKFNLKTDARQGIGTFFAIRERLENDQIQPSEYIDIRVPERAFVK